ncbi:MAG: hypothetical protein WCJ45_08875 [bacterium]
MEFNDIAMKFKLDHKLTILVDNLLCTIRQCSRNGSSFGGNNVGMSSTLI